MKTFSIIILAVLMTVSVDAQNFGNRLKNKVLNKLENKAEEKIDKSINSAVDKPVDKTEEKVKESVKGDGKESNKGSSSSSNQQGQPSQEDMAKYMEMMGGGAVSIEDYPDLDDIVPSSFVGSFDMDIKTTSKNGKVKDEGTVSWYIDKYDVVMIPKMEENKGQESKIITNRKKGVMTILTNDNGKKSGIVMKMKTIVVDLSETEVDDDYEDMNVQILKNQKQTVNGYPCYKIVASNDEMESVSWVTESIDLNMEQMFSFMNVKAKDGSNAYENKFAQFQGWPIKTTSTDKKSGEVSVMEMKNIKDGYIPANIASTEGYSLMMMPDFGGAFGQ